MRENVLTTDSSSCGRPTLPPGAVLILFLVLLAWLVVPPRGVAADGASWVVDPHAFHASAHGWASCLDCHEDVAGRDPHPDPGMVNRNPRKGFSPDRCLDCHDGVLEEIRSGSHAEGVSARSEATKACLACHDPHEEVGSEHLGAGGFDPTRPVRGQCGACHEPEGALPPPGPDDQACMSCHGLAASREHRDPERVERLCLHCHGAAGTAVQRATSERALLVEPEGSESPHAGMGCTVCHLQAAAYPHGEQRLGDCTGCHERHAEKVAHDAHLRVACEACHLEGARPVPMPETGLVSWEREQVAPSRVHALAWSGGEARCARCHSRGNKVGASALILPPKSVLCMPCHPATFSVGDPVTWIALIVFLIGISMTGAWILTGSRGASLEARGWGTRPVSKRVRAVAGALLLDGLLQRRLHRQSPKRWRIHALIFWPFVIRFLWGMAGLLGSLWAPGQDGVWVLLDKNHPLTALVFDVTGLMLLLGVALALVRRPSGVSSEARGLPGRDLPALVLILLVVGVGFVLEGMRLAMSCGPPGSRFAFAGWALSLPFSGVQGLTMAYGYVWYVHAVLTGAFVAYLPFSRLIHVITAPVVLALNASGREER